MRLLLALLAGMLIVGGNARAQQPLYDQAQLDAMLAPIALQPDGVVSQVLIAATYPDEVAAAASWARANPHMRGDAALRAVANEPWDPAVKALVAFPELLIRMDESPQWMRDLGQAFIQQEAQVMDTVQGLRRRAQAAGNLNSSDQYSVYPEGDAIVVQPRSQIVYVRYYDPFVVYGPWWWPQYYPVYWRPWAPRPVFIAHGFWYAKPIWHQHHVHVVHRPVHVHAQHAQHVVPGKWQPIARPFGKQVPAQRTWTSSKPYVRVPESQRQPIVQQPMPAASGFTGHQRTDAQRSRGGPQQERSAPVQQQRSFGNQAGQPRAFNNHGGQPRTFSGNGGHPRTFSNNQGGQQRTFSSNGGQGRSFGAQGGQPRGFGGGGGGGSLKNRG